jgi:tetratricopeptide (TPR) repeat protein
MAERKDATKTADQSRVAGWFRDGLYILLGLSILVIVVPIAMEVFGGSFMIDPISVPEELAKRGITAETVAARIRDEMGRLESESRMGGEENTIKAIVEGASTPEINVLGTSISVRYIADALRDMLPFSYKKFSGDLSIADQSESADDSDAAEADSASSRAGEQPKLRLVLRESHDSKWLFEGKGTYYEVVREGALAALQRADPYPAAIYLSRRRAKHAEALALIESNLTVPSRKGSQLVLPDKNLPRGQLARGYVLMDMGEARYDDAEKAFKQADKDYKQAYSTDRDWDAAGDGQAILDIYRKNYDKALEDAQKAIDANPGYESAIYHSAQADDERFRAFISDPVPPGACAAFAKAKSAQDKYDVLIDKDPLFGAAYSQEAIMLAKELAYVRASNKPKCESPIFYLKELVGRFNEKELAGTINERFEMGLANDPDFFNGWYEWGLFLFRLIEERDIRSPDPSNDLINGASPDSIADAAIDKYDHAIRLVETDKYLSEVNAYFWLRKAQALGKRIGLQSTPDSLRRKKLKSAYDKYNELVANVPNGPSDEEKKIEAELQPFLGAVLAGQNGER